METGESKYSLLFQTGMKLTNTGILFNASRTNDRRLYVAVHNRMITIVENIVAKRSNSQAAYREQRQKQLSGSKVVKNSKISKMELRV